MFKYDNAKGVLNADFALGEGVGIATTTSSLANWHKQNIVLSATMYSIDYNDHINRYEL